MKKGILIILFIFSACSDSGTESSSGDPFARVETIYDLGECDAVNAGVVKRVESEGKFYTCRRGVWRPEEEKNEILSSSAISSESENSSNNALFVDPSSVVEGDMTDERDGQSYRTVKIGNQVWMAENLNYRYLGPTGDKDSSSFCRYDDPAYCDIYGRLYLWSAAMDSAGIINGNTPNGCGKGTECSPGGIVRGVCPQGWHLPNRVEWEQLIVAVDGSITEYDSYNYNTTAPKLKSTSGWGEEDFARICSHQSYLPAEDTYSFSVLPAGFWNGRKYVVNLADFWSSDEDPSWRKGASYSMFFMCNDAFIGSREKPYGSSVRCLKDDGVSSSSNKNDTESSSSSESSSSNKDNTGSSSSSVSSSSNINNMGSSSSSLSSSSSKNNTGLSSSNVSSSSSKDNTSSSSSSVSSSSSKNNTGASSSSVDHCKGVTYDESTEICDSRDGQVYRTTTINIPSKSYSEVWMAENLNFDTTGSYCDNCSKYGRLYTWEVAKKVCPTGWNLPNKEDFEMLIDAVGGADVAGGMLKSTSGWEDNGNGSDKYGFSALPASSYSATFIGNFLSDGLNAYFWSSTNYNSSSAYIMYLRYHDDYAHVANVGRKDDQGLSVRCLKN